MVRHETIKMDYPGNCISVNHYLGRRKDGGYYIKPEAREWKEEFGWLLKRLHLEDWRLPLEVTCSATFTSEHRACDLANFGKVILDTIEEVTGINDKNMRWRDGNRVIDPKQTPYLLITISELTSGYSPIATKLKSRGIEGMDNSKPIRGRKRGLKTEGRNG